MKRFLRRATLGYSARRWSDHSCDGAPTWWTGKGSHANTSLPWRNTHTAICWLCEPSRYDGRVAVIEWINLLAIWRVPTHQTKMIVGSGIFHKDIAADWIRCIYRCERDKRCDATCCSCSLRYCRSGNCGQRRVWHDEAGRLLSPFSASCINGYLVLLRLGTWRGSTEDSLKL